MLEMKWRRGGGKVAGACLVLALVASLILPAVAYAAQPDSRPGDSGIKIVKKSAFTDGGQKGQRRIPDGGHQFARITGRLGALSAGQKSYAIVIGSNYIGSAVADGQIPLVPPFSMELEYAEADAQAMAGLLGAYGFDEVIALVGDSASRSNILDAIKHVRQVAEDDDQVVFFYSGHGASVGHSSPSASQHADAASSAAAVHQGIVSDQGDGKNVDFLWDAQLAKEFRDFRTDRIVFVFDACLMGGMTELMGKGRIVLMATTSTGIAVEVGIAPDGTVVNHGLFTFGLLAALSGLVPEADAYDHLPGVPDVTVEEAYNFASFSLIQMTPLIQGALAFYYGEEIAALWATPVVLDLFPADMLLQALPEQVEEKSKKTPAFHGK